MSGQQPEWLRALSAASSAGFTLLGSIVVGVFIGSTVDSFFYVRPWGLIFFSLLGAFSGLWSIYKQVVSKK